MVRMLRIFLLLIVPGLGALAVAVPVFAQDEAMILMAHPAFRDLEYRQTVLIAAPAPNGGHVGVILNRPTRRSLGSLFPEHEPSKKVLDPVFYGGPLSPGAPGPLGDPPHTPRPGPLPPMKDPVPPLPPHTTHPPIATTPHAAPASSPS